MNNKYPVGQIVELTAKATRPNKSLFKGEYVSLSLVSPEKDVKDLYEASNGDPEKDAIWTYMPMSGPFSSEQEMFNWLQLCQSHKDFIFYTVRQNDTGKAVGMVSYVSIVEEMRRLEVGFIWYTPAAQRTKINTESIYLLLSEAFDNLEYRRVEWKCDSLNKKSRNAALRLGFSFEGLFRNHMIVKGRNRDTAWYAMTDHDWPKVKNHMQEWLYSENPGTSLSELNKKVLRDIEQNT